jgi:hypothetical protein
LKLFFEHFLGQYRDKNIFKKTAVIGPKPQQLKSRQTSDMIAVNGCRRLSFSDRTRVRNLEVGGATYDLTSRLSFVYSYSPPSRCALRRGKVYSYTKVSNPRVNFEDQRPSPLSRLKFCIFADCVRFDSHNFNNALAPQKLCLRFFGKRLNKQPLDIFKFCNFFNFSRGHILS